METLEIKKQNAVKAYNEGSNDVKNALLNLFGKETFVSQNICDQVKTFEDACKVLSIDPISAIPEAATPALQKDELSIQAYCKLIIIGRALNEGWKPDWKNGDQYKWYPWFDMSSGSGLAFDAYVRWLSITFVGSRLCFKSRELAEYAGRQFLSIYQEFMIL